MPIPPPKKKSLPPAKYKRAEPIQNGLRFQPNILLESESEILKWIDVSYPGRKARLIKTWKVNMIAFQIEVKHIPINSTICPFSKLISFKTWKDADEFNNKECGHIPILEKWECVHCKGWHYWGAGSHPDSNGAFKSGVINSKKININGNLREILTPVIPEHIRNIINQSKA